VQSGVSASLLSAVGQDPLGDEILEVAQHKGVNVQFVSRTRIGLPTGTVVAVVDAMGNATYEIVQPVAWDEITVSAEAVEAVAKASAFIFGSLASRSPYNREQLERILVLKGPLKFLDVNLRPPFADPKRIVELAARADVIKLNHDESRSVRFMAANRQGDAQST
jgi:fructokinase